VKIRHGVIVDGAVSCVYAMFRDDLLWNEKALADRKSDSNNTNKKNKSNVGGHWRPVPRSKKSAENPDSCGFHRGRRYQRIWSISNFRRRSYIQFATALNDDVPRIAVCTVQLSGVHGVSEWRYYAPLHVGG